MPTADSIATVFGSVNSVIDQTTNSILKIENAQKQLNGSSPTLQYGAFGSGLKLPTYTTTQWIGLGLIAVVGVAILYILYREYK